MTIAKFQSIPKMKSAVKASGSHFFDEFYVNMLNSKIEPPMIGGAFFITSEYREDPAEKKYTARYWEEPLGPDADRTIGEPQAYDSIPEARAAIMQFQVDSRLARDVTSLLAAVGVEVFEASTGYKHLRLEDGTVADGVVEVFGHNTLDRSGIRWHTKEGLDIFIVGDYATGRRFAEHVRSLAFRSHG